MFPRLIAGLLGLALAANAITAQAAVISATVEFTGRGGVFDFLRHYNLRIDDALNISDHLPVWAEFSIFEGATAPAVNPPHTPGRVADGTDPVSR